MSVNPFLTTPAHSARKHSKFSASGSERWINCQGSVKLSEGIESKSSIWAKEGEEAHEVLEKMLNILIEGETDLFAVPARDDDMWGLGREAAAFIHGLWRKLPHSEIQVETRIILDFIHPEMFGTFDGAVVDHFGTLHVFDYKYGAGVAVSPDRNLQMAFYAIGLAHQYQWNFKRVRMWIIQPRIKGYEGPLYWEIPILELKGKWVRTFEYGVDMVERFPDRLTEGSWCHWCPAKKICPLKTERKNEKASLIFGSI